MMKNKILLLTLVATFMTGTCQVTAYARVPDNVDTTVIDEEEKEEEDHVPLTPDGNMSLVDDIASNDGHSKEFMTVSTKNGNIFYIIVDRDDKGTNTVHFLNQVDERDLIDLISDEDKEELEAQIGAKIETPVEPVTPIPEEPAKEEVVDEEPKPKANTNPILGLIIVLGLAGVAGFYFYSNRESFRRRKDGEDPDRDYSDDYIDIPEDDKEGE